MSNIDKLIKNVEGSLIQIIKKTRCKNNQIRLMDSQIEIKFNLILSIVDCESSLDLKLQDLIRGLENQIHSLVSKRAQVEVDCISRGFYEVTITLPFSRLSLISINKKLTFGESG